MNKSGVAIGLDIYWVSLLQGQFLVVRTSDSALDANKTTFAGSNGIGLLEKKIRNRNGLFF